MEQQFELRVDEDADAEQIANAFAEQLRLDGIELKSCEVEQAFGMSGAEVVISILINLGTGIAIQIWHKRIEQAAEKVAEKFKAAIKVIFPKDPKDPSDPSDSDE